MDTIVYRIADKLYINLTNRCNNDCVFCVRNAQTFEGYSLWLSKEPTADEVITAFKRELTPQIREAVFCGYGEPLYCLGTLIEVCRYLKSINMAVRLNTNGQAALIAGEGVADKLTGLVDTVSISLNAASAEEYVALCRPEHGAAAFKALLDFATELKGKARVILSVVDCIGAKNIERCRIVAEGTGAEFRVRETI